MMDGSHFTLLSDYIRAAGFTHSHSDKRVVGLS
jgi:hypothetical protein